MQHRRLGPSDRQLLESFTCRDFRQPWTDIVQEVVRSNLPEELERSTVIALGAFDGLVLAGLIVWRMPDDNGIIRSAICSVAHGYQRRGVAQDLKRSLLKTAREEGVVAVVSQVHNDNDAMLAVNTKLGARLTRDPADPSYWNCILDIE